MIFYRWRYEWANAIVFSVMISGCGARVVVPQASDFGSPSPSKNAQIERPNADDPDSSADGTVDAPAADPSNADPTSADPAEIDRSAVPAPNSGAPVVLDPPDDASPAVVPVVFASPRPVEVIEKPAPENAGPVSIVIDAPVGATTRYRFDGDDPVDSGLSFDLSPIPPGEHSLDVEVLIPGGPSEHFEFRWTQVADSRAKKQKHGRKDGDSRGHKKDHHDQRWHKDREKHQPEDKGNSVDKKGKRDERKLHD
jgi:hypothetical protein